MNRKTLWLSISLLIAAAISIFLMLLSDHSNKKASAPIGMNSFMMQPEYQQFNNKGQLHSRLEADQMKHLRPHNISLFTKPRILIYTDDRIPWHITSHYGKSLNGNKTIYLYDHVILHQPPQPHHPETTITTSFLTIYPKRALATTDRKVTITRPGSIIHGKGIEANLKTGSIKLLAQSRGIYAPTKKP
jgi:lipopolysaccharide export system protein LptC